jgi:hypothetical protein
MADDIHADAVTFDLICVAANIDRTAGAIGGEDHPC